jgi:ankyrin repeat protein
MGKFFLITKKGSNMFRVDRLCDLAANSTTLRSDFEKFIRAEPIDINNRHTNHGTRPVAFVAQSGNLDNFKFLVEEMHASLDAQPEFELFNLLQWTHDFHAAAEIKAYLLDPEKKLWLQFNDGMGELQLAAYLGQCNVVENLLDQDPERICEMTLKRYTPLYWANLGEQAEMQALLTRRLAAYREQHTAQDEVMLRYHFGMAVAALGARKSYAEFADFLALGKKFCAEPTLQSAMDGYLKSILKLCVIAHNNLIGESEAVDNSMKSFEYLQLVEQKQLHQRCIQVIEQRLKANGALHTRTQSSDNARTSDRMTLLESYSRIAEHYSGLIVAENAKEIADWDAIQKYLNQSYNYLQQGFIIDDDFEDTILSADEAQRKKDFIKKITSAMEALLSTERQLTALNNHIKIARPPIVSLFRFLDNRDLTPQMVADYLAENPVDPHERYRGDSFIERALSESSTNVVIFLLQTYKSALAVTKEQRNLMHVLKNNVVGKSTRDYILDPTLKIWEDFADGTTQLHVDAFAGRIDAVCTALIAAPDRLMEINVHGENVFYWAFHSQNNIHMMNALADFTLTFMTVCAQNNDWQKILKFYESFSHYLKKGPTAKQKITLFSTHAKWLDSQTHDESQDYIKVHDLMHTELANNYLELAYNTETENRINCRHALKAALKVIAAEKRLKLQHKIHLETIESHHKAAEAIIVMGENANFDGRYDEGLEHFEDAQNALGLAISLCSEWIAIPAFQEIKARLDASMTDVEAQVASIRDIMGLGVDSDPKVVEHADHPALAIDPREFLSLSSNRSTLFSPGHSSSSSSSSVPAIPTTAYPSINTSSYMSVLANMSDNDSDIEEKKSDRPHMEDVSDEKSEKKFQFN